MRVVMPLLVTVSHLAFGGCAGIDSHPASDCVSPFHFGGQTYLVGPQPPDEQLVKPGRQLDDGAYESCDQYSPRDHSPGDGSDGLDEPRPVHACPGVPPEQVIVLTVADGSQPTVLLATEEPEGGWDSDLRPWLGTEAAD
jgi:hypothetical protein